MCKNRPSTVYQQDKSLVGVLPSNGFFLSFFLSFFPSFFLSFFLSLLLSFFLSYFLQFKFKKALSSKLQKCTLSSFLLSFYKIWFPTLNKFQWTIVMHFMFLCFLRRREPWASADFFSRGGHKFSWGGQEPTFCLKKQQQKNILFLAGLCRPKGGQEPPLPPPLRTPMKGRSK
jgi:hypothetical protein